MMDAYEAMRAVLNWMDGGPEPEFGETQTPMEKEHGPVVDVKMAAYGDWLIYADGTEEYRSIGD